MGEVLKDDLIVAVENVVEKIEGIDELYPIQMLLLSSLVKRENVFFTSATNSGKTLPAVIFPQVLDELIKLGYNISSGKVLFVTALNSIQMSLVASMKSLGLECEALSVQNFAEVLASDVRGIFVSPEVMKLPRVSSCLLEHRQSFVLKVIDEAHLGVNINEFELVLNNDKKALTLCGVRLNC